MIITPVKIRANAYQVQALVSILSLHNEWVGQLQQRLDLGRQAAASVLLAEACPRWEARYQVWAATRPVSKAYTIGLPLSVAIALYEHLRAFGTATSEHQALLNNLDQALKNLGFSETKPRNLP